MGALHSSRPDCGDVSGDLLVSPAPDFSFFRLSNAHSDIAGVACGHPEEEPPVGITLARSRPDCGDVSGGSPVSSPQIPQLSEQIARMS